MIAVANNKTSTRLGFVRDGLEFGSEGSVVTGTDALKLLRITATLVSCS